MEYTIEMIKQKVSSDPKWAARALTALYNRQTADEQATDSTRHINGAGFNGLDAEILSSFARQVIAGRTLSQKQLTILYKKLPKYAGQLARIAAANAAA